MRAKIHSSSSVCLLIPLTNLCLLSLHTPHTAPVETSLTNRRQGALLEREDARERAQGEAGTHQRTAESTSGKGQDCGACQGQPSQGYGLVLSGVCLCVLICNCSVCLCACSLQCASPRTPPVALVWVLSDTSHARHHCFSFPLQFLTLNKFCVKPREHSGNRAGPTCRSNHY